jgi:hypothetical protein
MVGRIPVFEKVRALLLALRGQKFTLRASRSGLLLISTGLQRLTLLLQSDNPRQRIDALLGIRRGDRIRDGSHIRHKSASS